MRQLKIALAALATSIVATSAHSAAPEVGDQFRLNNGTVLVVAKIKLRPDVSQSLVCLHRSGGRPPSCAWSRVGDLHGDWVTYGGVPQNP